MKKLLITSMCLYLIVCFMSAGTPLTPSETLKAPVISSGLDWKPGDPLALADGRVVFDLEERLRVELRENNFDFDSNVQAVTDDSYLLQRVKIGLMLKPSDTVSLYLQAQDSREFFADRPSYPGFNGAEGDSVLGLKQAWLNLKISDSLQIKTGRQEINLGDQRLVGAFDWNNIGRVFDGVRAQFAQDDLKIEAFALMPVNMRISHFNDTDFHDRFFGVYSSLKPAAFLTTDFYGFFRNKTDTDAGFPTGGSTFETPFAPNTVAGSQAGDYATLGTRIASVPGQLNGWDFALEANGQVGTIINNAAGTSIRNATTRRRDLLAFAGFIQGGYTFDAEWKPRLGLGYDYASGDENFTDGTGNSFQNLFPTNHKFYGFMDLFAWRNLHNPRAHFSVTPVKDLQISLDYHAFFLAETNDYWYRANGFAPVRTGANRINASSFAGQEIDLVVRYPLFKWLRAEAGYSHFFAGSYLRQTGAGADADFFYTQATMKF